jgi:hypothetical protein
MDIISDRSCEGLLKACRDRFSFDEESTPCKHWHLGKLLIPGSGMFLSQRLLGSSQNGFLDSACALEAGNHVPKKITQIAF